MNVNHAMIAAFERSDYKQRSRDILRAFTMLLVAVFFIALMACLAVAARLYSDVVGVQDRTSETHVQSSFVANVVHAGDEAGALKAVEGPEGPALVLVETLPTGSYETRIYCYQGTVYQEYAVAGAGFNPASAVALFESGTLDFGLQGSLLTMKTDQGQVQVALRTRQDALQESLAELSEGKGAQASREGGAT